MSLRERRLKADERALRRLEAGSSWVKLLELQGAPAERYRLEYRVPGLVVEGQSIVRAERHIVEIYLTLAYPRQAPQCRMLTPVFHPNIAPHAVCIGDHWAAGESLAALVVRIAEMLCFQSYNVKSPLNGQAARWADEHPAELPLDRTDFGTGLRDREDSAATRDPAEYVAPAPIVERAAPPSTPQASAVGSTRGLVPERPPDVVCSACHAVFTVSRPVGNAWVRCPLCGRVVATHRVDGSEHA